VPTGFCDADFRPNSLRARSGWRSDNFVIGLTNVSALISPPAMGSYAVCGRYPGAVPDGATVSLRCDETANQAPARYVIAQFPVTHNYMNFCELDVCAAG